MRLKHRILSGIIILFLVVALIPPVSAFEDEQTRHIEHQDPGFDADWFATESGIGHGGPLVTVLDPNLDIYSYLWFEDIKVNYWHYVENATLRLWTASSMDFDADSSFTIYGVNDYRYFGSGTKGSHPFATPSELMNAPLTSAHVNINSSQFHGSHQWDIDVTNIVRELKSNPHWDGPGFVRSDPGDNMAFIMLGAKGHDSRWFYALQAGNGKEAQLNLHWGGSSHPPSGYPDAIFNQAYRNNTIWEIPGGFGFSLEPMEYLFVNGSAPPYNINYDDLNGSGPYLVSQTEFPSSGLQGNMQNKLVRIDNGTLFACYSRQIAGKYQVHVKQSDDEGVTWYNEVLISTLAGMEVNDQIQSVMAVDGADRLHLTWMGKATGWAVTKIWHALYNGTWNEPIGPLDVGLPSMNLYSNELANIAVDSNNVLHASFRAKEAAHPVNTQIYYVKYTNSWSTPLRISTKAGMEDYAQGPWSAIAIDSDNYIHVAWAGRSDDHTIKTQLYRAKYDGSWTIDHVSVGMTGNNFGGPDIAIDSEDNIHVCSQVTDIGNQRVYYSLFDGSWQNPYHLSVDQTTGHNWYCTIGVDSEDHIHVIWRGYTLANGVDDIQHAEYNGTAWNKQCLQPTGKDEYPTIRWARWPIGEPGTYLVVDINGTVLAEGFETVEEAEDWIEDYEDDPEDPDPGGEWSEGPGGETGPFSRFKLRLYLLILGFGCVFGPILFFSWRRPTGYYLAVGAIIMIAGLGFLLAIGDI